MSHCFPRGLFHRLPIPSCIASQDIRFISQGEEHEAEAARRPAEIEDATRRAVEVHQAAAENQASATEPAEAAARAATEVASEGECEAGDQQQAWW